jgi:hypothetical protein
MLKLVSTVDLVLSRLRSAAQRVCSAFTLRSILCLGLLVSGAAHAVDISMPTVDVDGVDDDADGATIVVVIVKYVVRIAIWACMVVAGIVCLKNILKSWNEQKSNDQGKWGAVVGDSLGSVIMVILLIALGTWALTFIA